MSEWRCECPSIQSAWEIIRRGFNESKKKKNVKALAGSEQLSETCTQTNTDPDGKEDWDMKTACK